MRFYYGGRLTTLENKYVRTTRFVSISSGTSGTVTLPPNSSVVLDDFGGATDAVVSKINSGRPTYEAALDSSGNILAATFDVGGNWTISGTPSAYPIALIYRVQQSLVNFDSTSTDIIGPLQYGAAFGTIVGTAGSPLLADNIGDTLTLTSSNSSVVMTGTPSTDTMDFAFNTTFGDGRYVLKAGDTMTGNLTLRAGGTAAGTSPLKFQAGSLLATPENGAMEYDGTNLYFTATSARRIVTLQVGAVNMTPGSVTFAGTGGDLQEDNANFFWDDTTNQLRLAATGSSAGILIGGDALLYRTAADELRTPDSLTIDTRAAVGTSLSSLIGINAAITTNGNSSFVGVQAANTVTGAVTSAFPKGIYGNVSLSAGLNGISYISGGFFSVRSEATQAGAITEAYGLDFDTWHRGAANINTWVGCRAFQSVRNTSSGTITLAAGYRAILDSQSAGTNSAITDYVGFDVVPSQAGNSVITRYTGLYVRNNTSGGTAATTNYGIRIQDLSWGTTNYGIYFDGTSGLARQGIHWNADTNLYRGAADQLKTDDSLYVNGGTLGVGVAPSTTNIIYSRSSGTSTTAPTAVFGEVIFTATIGPSSQRPRGLFFSATQSGAINYTDALGVTGFEGIAIANSSLTSEGACGGIVGITNSGSGTLVRAVPFLANTPTNSGGGHITNTRMIDIAAPNAYSANSQTRIGIRIAAIPDPGGFTGTTSAGIQFNSSTGSARDGILWSTDTNLYRSAAGSLKTDHGFIATTFLQIPNGAGGTTVDAAGEVCVDTTSRTLNFYDGTAEVVLNPIQSKAFVIETPVATDDMPIWATDVAITLTEVRYLCIGGTNWVGQLQECDANGINGVDVHSADITATAGTVNNTTTFSNASIDAGDWVGIKTTSISGTPTRLHVTFYFRENP